MRPSSTPSLGRPRRRHRFALPAAVLLVLSGCGEETPPAEPVADEQQETVAVVVYLANEELGDPCGEVFPVARQVPADDPLTGALEVLLAGPTAEERAAGYGGWFSEETAGMLRQVALVDGTIEADFDDLRPVIPGASSSCGSAGLLAQLDRTLLGVERRAEDTRYALEGDVDAFYEWLQLGAPDADDAPPPPPPPEDDQAAPVLEDGRHAVYLHDIDVGGRKVTFDLLQFLTGQAAIDAYEQETGDPDGPPNDYYILNVNPMLRTLPVATAVEVRLVRLHEGGGADLEPGTWEELPTYLPATGPTGDARLSPSPFWLRVQGGEVVAIEEQYLP